MLLDASAGLLDWQELSLDACALLSWLFHVYSHIWRRNNGACTATRSKAVRTHLRQCGSSSTLFTTSQASISLEASAPISKSTSPYIRGIQTPSIYVHFATSFAEIMLQVDTGIYFRVKTHRKVHHHNQKISKPWRIKLWTVCSGASFHSCQAFGAECWCALSPLEDWTCTGNIDRMPSPLLAPVCPQVETSVSSTGCFLEHFLPSALIFLTDEKNSRMFLAANLAVHCRVAIFAYVPNTQATETDSPPPSENFGQCVLFSSRGRCSDHKSNTETS